MEIAIIASDRKKELMSEFCLAYKGILGKHNLYATESTGKYISDVIGLHIECMLPGGGGGLEQLTSRISFNEIDLVLFFRDPMNAPHYDEAQLNLLRLCDMNNVPVATNIATAEALILALDQGSLDWRELVNPRYNKQRAAAPKPRA